MKPIIITISILLAGLTIATLNLRTTNAELKEQLQTALGYREQLNKQAEEYTRQRMEWNARLAELETQLLSTATQLNNLSEGDRVLVSFELGKGSYATIVLKSCIE